MPELTLQFCIICMAQLAGSHADKREGWEPDIPGVDYMLYRRDHLNWCDGCGQEPS